MPLIPEMKPVARSSNIKAYGYDDKLSTLYIDFHNNVRWSYEGVPLDVFREFEESHSKGAFFHAKIRSGPYTAKKLDAEVKSD